MNKKEATTIIERIARENACGWLEQVKRAGEVYYVHQPNRRGNSHKITLAVVVVRDGVGDLDFFWPEAAPGRGVSSEGFADAIRVLGGGYGEAADIAAKAVGFSLARRCFVRGGGGVDMVYECLEGLAARVGYAHHFDVTRTSMVRW